MSRDPRVPSLRRLSLPALTNLKDLLDRCQKSLDEFLEVKFDDRKIIIFFFLSSKKSCALHRLCCITRRQKNFEITGKTCCVSEIIFSQRRGSFGARVRQRTRFGGSFAKVVSRCGFGSEREQYVDGDCVARGRNVEVTGGCRSR